MPANRCTICGIDWPQSGEYTNCPQCGLKTSKFGNIDSLSPREARTLANHLRFDNFYADWDDTEPADRLDPAQDEDIQERYGQAYATAKIAEHRKPSRYAQRTPAAAAS